MSEVRSLLGMTTYSAHFIRDFATITKPVRRLACKDRVFQWGDEQDAAYEALKQALLKSPVMAYFDTRKEAIICVDASPLRLSARYAGEGGRREQASLLPFSRGSRGSKSALFKCNDLFSNC